MKIVTSAGNEYIVEWIDMPVTDENQLLLKMQTGRPIAEIVAEFDGLEWIERYDENQGDKRFDGFTRLVMVRIEKGKVMIAMERSSENA